MVILLSLGRVESLGVSLLLRLHAQALLEERRDEQIYDVWLVLNEDVLVLEFGQKGGKVLFELLSLYQHEERVGDEFVHTDKYAFLVEQFKEAHVEGQQTVHQAGLYLWRYAALVAEHLKQHLARFEQSHVVALGQVEIVYVRSVSL